MYPNHLNSVKKKTNSIKTEYISLNINNMKLSNKIQLYRDYIIFVIKRENNKSELLSKWFQLPIVQVYEFSNFNK